MNYELQESCLRALGDITLRVGANALFRHHGCLFDPGGVGSRAGWSNFGRLVLSCIDADFCVQIRILQHFSRSTRFAILCTAPSSKSQQKFDQLFQISAEIFAKITIFQQFSWNFPPILMKIYRHFAKYFRKWSTSFKFHNF